MVKKQTNSDFLLKVRIEIKNFFSSNLKTIILLVSCFVVLSISSLICYTNSEISGRIDISDYAVGKVADRDVIATEEISYVDEDATKLRTEAKLRLVPAVFMFDNSITKSAKERFSTFLDLLNNHLKTAPDSLSFSLEIQEAFPILEKTVTIQLFESKKSQEIIKFSTSVFSNLLDKGVISFPDEGMQKFNPSIIEVINTKETGIQRDECPLTDVLKADKVSSFVLEQTKTLGLTNNDAKIVESLITPFIRENLLFSEKESNRRLEIASEQVIPVLNKIEKGQSVIKKGFIITDQNMQDLQAISKMGFSGDRYFVNVAVFMLLCIAIIACILLSLPVIGKNLIFSEKIFLITSFSIVFLIALVTSQLQQDNSQTFLPLILPGSLFVMLTSILIKESVGIIFSLLLALGAMAATGMNIFVGMFILLSGIFGARVIRKTEKRIDLVRAAFILSIIDVLIFVFCIYVTGYVPDDFFLVFAGSAFNGFISGILVTGFLPLLESVMNTATKFRLMELSDLNSPVMKKMMLTAPGTYNHSLMVANLSESACSEIGANPLLARVGGYFHDLGKMEQPEYFTENQTDYNKHDDINPRLSATIIRSHVKIGVEKARQLHLPPQVIDVIAEHHGNSVIRYFYSEALKQDSSINAEDFSYPGRPPRSKESAVVMLADTVEAACRTLQRPSVSRLEKFISDLFSNKVSEGLLKNSELTLAELEKIKQSFVQTLAAYYHSRIEYPNQKDPDEISSDQVKTNSSKDEQKKDDNKKEDIKTK